MSSPDSVVHRWLTNARRKYRDGVFDQSDLEELGTILAAAPPLSTAPPAPPPTSGGQLRQRLLYLHADGMSTHARVLAIDLREPKRQAEWVRLSPKPDMPYNSVHDAIVNGWRVVQFPDPSAPIDDRELNIYGYQFILEKLEPFSD